MKFLFWNLHKKPIIENVARIALSNEIDIIMLAECNVEIVELLRELNRERTLYNCWDDNSSKVKIVTRFSSEYIPSYYQELSQEEIQEHRKLNLLPDYLDLRLLSFPDKDELILAVVHFPSKINLSEKDQFGECSRLGGLISFVETKRNHSRTILVGDMNMNPFDLGVVAANGLHGIMSKDIVLRKRSRIVYKQSYKFFYNPMWNLFGDNNQNPMGTHYYEKSGHIRYYWNMFDQVLIRPDLIPSFEDDSLEILNHDGECSLLRRGIPDKESISDHLPIIFTLNY